jgi:hypothetical protein
MNIKSIINAILMSSVVWAILLGIFQGGRAYQASLIKDEIKQCNVGNVCKLHTLNITLPLIMNKIK